MLKMCIIYSKISEYTSEKLSVAVLLYDANGVYFYFSENKLNVIKPLLGLAKYNYIFKFLKSIQKNYKHSYEKTTLFDSDYLNNDLIQSSINVNNTLIISEPIELDVEFNDVNIENLVKLNVDSQYRLEHEINRKDFVRLKNKFRKETQSNLSFKYSLSKNTITTLDIPFPLSFAGKNGSFVFGNFLSSKIENDIFSIKLSGFIDLSKKVKDQDPESSMYLISDMYEDCTKTDLINIVKNIKEFDLIDSTMENTLEVAQIIKSKNCLPMESISA